MSRRQQWATSALFIVSLIGLTACEKASPPEASIRPALVMQVQSLAYQGKLALVGEVKPRYSAVQGFRVPGKITKRYVEVGDLVKKGQLIARIDAADANLSVQANQAAISAAKANLALTESELKRQLQLLAKKFISPAALERYQTNYDLAKASLAQANAQNAVSRNQSAYTRLYADRSGVVNQIKAEPGQVVNAGDSIVTIISPKALEVYINVAEGAIDQIKRKQAVQVKLWADNQSSYPAVVREIAPVADPVTRTYLVKLQLKSIDDKLKMGMTVTAVINTNNDQAIMIPSTAVIQQGQQAIVWQVSPQNTVHAVPVSVAAYHESGVLISGGLSAEQTIVVAGAQALTENQAIQPVERKL